MPDATPYLRLPLHPPDALVAAWTAALADRRRTIWVARRLLASHRGRLITLVLDDGQYGAVERVGVYEDVMHTPALGFTLLVRGLADPSVDRRHPVTRKRTRVPMSFVRGCPPAFGFLREPPVQWPVPAPSVTCARSACAATHVTGRFCWRCGKLARRGPTSRVLGEGFAVMQRVLRAAGAARAVDLRACDCGAVVATTEAFCGKCGHAHAGPATGGHA